MAASLGASQMRRKDRKQKQVVLLRLALVSLTFSRWNRSFFGSNCCFLLSLVGRSKELMQSWAEMVLWCGVDWGCVLQLWHKVVLRKWLNIGSGSGDSDFSADEGDTTEGESDYEGYLPWPPLFSSLPLFLAHKLL